MAKDDNRYDVATKTESSLPFDILGIGDTIHTATVLDKQTGDVIEGVGWTEAEAKTNAFEKIGNK